MHAAIQVLPDKPMQPANKLNTKRIKRSNDKHLLPLLLFRQGELGYKNVEKLTFPDTFYDDFQRDHLHPVLMFKDFNSQGLFEKNDEFMTTADVPLLALKDIVKNPVNPFTKQILSDSIKHTQGAVVSSNDTWSPGQHGYSTFNIKDSEWYTVKDNIFDSRNWKKGK